MMTLYLNRISVIAFNMCMGLCFAFCAVGMPLGWCYGWMFCIVGYFTFGLSLGLWPWSDELWNKYIVKVQDRKRFYVKRVGRILLGRVGPVCLVVLGVLIGFLGLADPWNLIPIPDVRVPMFRMLILLPSASASFWAYIGLKEAWNNLQNIHVIEKNDYKAKYTES